MIGKELGQRAEIKEWDGGKERESPGVRGWGKLRGKHAVRLGLMTGEQGGKKAGWYREGQVR